MDFSIELPREFRTQDLVGGGITAVVAHLDAAIKFAHPHRSADLEREAQVYKRLDNSHDRILRYYGRLENGGLLLQYAGNGSIRQYLKRQENHVPLPTRIHWIKQIVSAVAFLHSRNVMHADISCNNIFLDDNLEVKLGDFGGSLIDAEDALVCYETSHEHPDLPGVSTKSELFALGSTMFEIMTGKRPYEGLLEHEISNAYADGRYPSLETLDAFRSPIASCWARNYGSVEDLERDVTLEGLFYQSSSVPGLTAPSYYCNSNTTYRSAISREYPESGSSCYRINPPLFAVGETEEVIELASLWDVSGRL